MAESNIERQRGGGRDPLLTSVWWLLTTLLVLCMVLGAFCLLAYPAMLLNKGYFLGVPMAKLIIWFDALPDKPNVHHHSGGISAGTILLTLVLFVLARVFRTGAEIQADLEGTV